REIRYLGTDVLEAGLRRLRRRAEEGGSNQRVLGFRGDLTLGLPLPENSVDVVLAHFSLYTLPGEGERRKALRLLGEVLRPSGRLVLVNPSKTYDPRAIVRESLQLLHHRKGWFSAGWHRCFVYPFSLHLGLKFVARQLRSGRWKAYELDELCREVEEAGFRIQHRETVYGGGAFLVTAGPEKPAGDLSGPITRVALPAASE
ncbi:MAG: methyltransferase domain-containing protein, partial [Nitrospinaceae bacterium]|nr:class I SAM-dependent methyltransferase [Nitrospinaceae bacterium]NIR55276.1 class I SAM-dependent methyltransferase [Nitrospinaceae bacterium]NIS85714.1 class I SAM-dependent methyltransferase [Nitrospinaceae bacterium]NIT82565.1 class I SAM-dependent methyltransferase [Nitrospinaceae bacterium]NIU44769.1 class I SAM-dependent methyltransferase [Nitrospinaceae bacterium]